MKAPLAAVTMVYNEQSFLPAWLRHYGSQVGLENCFILDHGSSDGSTLPRRTKGASVVRIPRSPQDDSRRCGFVSDFCASLLTWYEAVIYVDVDELLLPDPALFGSLRDFAGSVGDADVVTAVGLDMIHVPELEPDFDWAQHVGLQRSWLRFSSAMCKPVLIRRRVNWAPGFHCIDAAPCFRHALFLFHLRYVDLPSGLARLQRTRAQAWASEQAGSHQRMSDERWEGMLRSMAGLPRREDVTLHWEDPVLQQALARVVESGTTRNADLYRLDLHISGDDLWRMPERFRSHF